MPLYDVSIHDPQSGEHVHTLPKPVRAEEGWKAVKDVVKAYGFTRAWPLRAKLHTPQREPVPLPLLSLSMLPA